MEYRIISTSVAESSIAQGVREKLRASTTMFNHLAQFNRQSNKAGMPIDRLRATIVIARMIQSSMTAGVSS